LSEPDDWWPRTHGGKHGNRGNNNDRYSDQDKVSDKVHSRNIIGFKYECQARVNRTFAASISDVKFPNIRNAQNLSSISEDEKFQRYLDKREAQLNEAQKGLQVKIEVGAAELAI